MKKSRISLLVVAVLFGLAAGGVGLSLAKDMGGKGDMAVSETGQEGRTDVLYYCACGEGCSCGSVSKTPGNCSCGKPMKWGHIVKVEEDEALVCTCGEGCRCQQSPDDPTKCGCGNTLKRVSLKGTGIYFCNCGGSCTCNTASDEFGKCKCGMNLKKM